MQSQGISRGILVIQSSLTPSAQKALAEMPSLTWSLESFLEVELLVNITEHVLVPRHQLLTLAEKKELLAR